jgi:hypothetical protein
VRERGCPFRSWTSITEELTVGAVPSSGTQLPSNVRRRGGHKLPSDTAPGKPGWPLLLGVQELPEGGRHPFDDERPTEDREHLEQARAGCATSHRNARRVNQRCRLQRMAFRHASERLLGGFRGERIERIER